MSVAMPNKITAAMLYDLVQCPHRVTMDLFADPVRKEIMSAHSSSCYGIVDRFTKKR